MRLTLGILAWTLLAHDAAAQRPSVTPSSTSGGISGRVVSTYAGLIADAIVTLARIDANGVLVDPRTTASDRQGGFSFERVAAGPYQVSASKPGYTNRRLLPFTGVGTGRPRASLSRPHFETGVEVTVNEGERVTGLELTLRRAASIAGRIAEPDGILNHCLIACFGRSQQFCEHAHFPT